MKGFLSRIEPMDIVILVLVDVAFHIFGGGVSITSALLGAY